MHAIQRNILNFAGQINLKRDSLRQIGHLIGEPHPFKVSYHLKQLEKNGLIEIDKKTGDIKSTNKETTQKGLFCAIPILGNANCGDATVCAEQNLAGHIKISKKIIKAGEGLIAIKASGNSMNKAKVDGNTIEDGDYVIVDTKKEPHPKDIVLSVIDDCANIKKYMPDRKNGTICLIPESTENHPIIVLDESDKFLINGVVKYVIKKPTVNWS